jgi:hypothetical protein
MDNRKIRDRVVKAAEQALGAQRYVSAVDLFLRMGWLEQTHVDDWRKGRVEYLERVIHTNLSKVNRALDELKKWAVGRGLKPSVTV